MFLQPKSLEKKLKRPRLIFLITEDWYFWTHRKSIALAAKEAGFEVIIATRVHKHRDLIERAGLRIIPIKLRRKSRNLLNELSSIIELVSIYRRERPAIVHHVTIKPVLYGSWASVLSGNLLVVNALAGLGHVFVAQGLRASIFKRVIILAYLSALRIGKSRVIFQNPEDKEAFVRNRIIASGNAVLIRGSGVDLEEFKFCSEPTGIPVVVLAGRLLWNKGVGELVKATELLKSRGIRCRIVMVGVPDEDNPRSVPEAMLMKWEASGLIEWWGRRDNMPDVLSEANLVVLPTTYGEGVPKILIEAAAVGRAIVATDAPGCREIVRHGENGLLVPAGSVSALADAIATLLSEPSLRRQMGRRGREIAESEFSEEMVVSQTLKVYRELLGERWPGGHDGKS